MEWAYSYDVSGTIVTTPYNLHLEAVVKEEEGAAEESEGGGGDMFVGDAAGVFFPAAMPLMAGAKLRTNDLRGLCLNATLFLCIPAPSLFYVAFYDSNKTLLGDIFAGAGQTELAVGRWSPAHL